MPPAKLPWLELRFVFVPPKASVVMPVIANPVLAPPIAAVATIKPPAEVEIGAEVGADVAALAVPDPVVGVPETSKELSTL